MSGNSPGTRSEITERLVADLGAAFQQRAVYARNHPQVQGAFARLLASFGAWCAQAGAEEVSLIVLEGQLLVDRQAVPEDAPWARGVLRAFGRHGIRGLTLVRGLDAEELGAFLDGCQGAAGPTPSRHLLVGQAGFADGEAAGEGTSGGGLATGDATGPMGREQVEGAGAELVGIADGAVARIDRLRGLVAYLARIADAGELAALRQAATQVNEPELLHGLAVAMTTMRLARALRVEGRALEDLALAGLVHDVGYLEAVRLEEDPANRRTSHPLRGAARLAALEGIPDVAVQVAYEHHLRFDLAPNYPALNAPRLPTEAARVVSVADTWETLRSHGGEPAEALALLRSRAGTFLDPALVELLAALVRRPGA